VAALQGPVALHVTVVKHAHDNDIIARRAWNVRNHDKENSTDAGGGVQRYWYKPQLLRFCVSLPGPERLSSMAQLAEHCGACCKARRHLWGKRAQRLRDFHDLDTPSQNQTKSDGIPKLGMIWPTVPATNSLQDTHG
jgi:hypothetical protein